MNEETTERYPLDEDTIGLFADMAKQMDALNNQWRGAFALYLRQHKLAGAWKLADNGRELERLPAEQVRQQQDTRV